LRRLLLALLVCGAVACGRTSGAGAKIWVEPTTGMAFVSIPSGKFTMGSPPDEAGREARETQHSVTIPKPFWMGKFEVTQAEWQAVMGGNPSSFHASGGDFPVEQVNWFEVHEFLNRLAARAPGNRFRLPTEAEWEYACRAGTTTAYNTGPSLTRDQANITVSATTAPAERGQTTRVGSFPPNPWGLYDMHGNVWEWTDDDTGPLKIIRGGSWYYGADSARCALRYTHRPQDRGFSLGFRVVREQE
jgi:formylglycine-generating enzyme required for sulfatase activity